MSSMILYEHIKIKFNKRQKIQNNSVHSITTSGWRQRTTITMYLCFSNSRLCIEKPNLTCQAENMILLTAPKRTVIIHISKFGCISHGATYTPIQIPLLRLPPLAKGTRPHRVLQWPTSPPSIYVVGYQANRCTVQIKTCQNDQLRGEKDRHKSPLLRVVLESNNISAGVSNERLITITNASEMSSFTAARSAHRDLQSKSVGESWSHQLPHSSRGRILTCFFTVPVDGIGEVFLVKYGTFPRYWFSVIVNCLLNSWGSLPWCPPSSLTDHSFKKSSLGSICIDITPVFKDSSVILQLFGHLTIAGGRMKKSLLLRPATSPR